MWVNQGHWPSAPNVVLPALVPEWCPEARGEVMFTWLNWGLAGSLPVGPTVLWALSAADFFSI